MSREALTRHQTRVPPSEGSVRHDLCAAKTEIAAHSWALSAHHRQFRELDGEVKTLVDVLAGVVGVLNQVSATNTSPMQEVSALKNRVERLEATIQCQDTTNVPSTSNCSL